MNWPWVIAVLLAAAGAISPRLAASGVLSLEAGDRLTIVLPEQPSATERFAADELTRYLQRMLAVEMGATPSDLEVHVGRTPANREDAASFDPSPIGAGHDSFLIAVEPHRVRLVGGSDRATLYAVYALLEQMGCRWFAPGELGEVVPQHKQIQLPLGKRLEAPANVTREIGGGPAAGQDPLDLLDWCVKNRLNRKFALREPRLQALCPDRPEAADAWAKRGGMERWQWIAHNFSFMFPEEEGWFERHPAYFALYQGRRIPLGTPGRPGYGGGNLALTNEDVVRHCARFAIDWFDRHPDGTVVPMWPGDGAIKWDESPQAMALGGRNFTPGPEGSMTRRLATFVNKVARLVGQAYPDRLILLPAYANYIRPVPDLELEPNVLVQYCYHGDYAHGPEQSPVNAEAVDQMRQWAQQANHFGVWEYFLIGDHTASEPVPVLLPLVYRVRDTMRFLHGIGSTRYFTQSNNAYQKYNPLLYYAVARYAWGPTLDADALIDDFCTGMYGPAAGKQMASFYKAMERSCAASDWRPQVYSDVAQPSPAVFTPRVLEELASCLEQAEAASVTPAQAQRLALVREAFEYTRANVRTLAAAGLDADMPWRLERGEEAYIVNADAPQIDADRFNDLVRHAVDTGQYTEQFERMVFRARKRREPIVWIENEALRVGVLPGLGGRMIRLIDKRTGRNLMEEHPDQTELDSIGARYFNYGGYEEYIGSGFAGPGWEWAFDHRVQQQADLVAIVVMAVTDAWRWERRYELPRGDERDVAITSRLTNRRGQAVETRLRTHPQFTLGGDTSLPLLIHALSGELVRTTLAQEHDSLSTQPAGAWAVLNPDRGTGVVHRFDPAKAEAYVFAQDDYFQLELFGKPVTLAPGETLTLRQRIGLVDDMQQAQALLAQPLPPEPASSPLDDAPPNARLRITPEGDVPGLRPGLVGQAAAFTADRASGLLFDARLLRPEAGTVECWVRLPDALAQSPHGWLLSAGQNQPAWWYIAAGQGQLVFLTKQGQLPYTGPEEHYASLSTDLLDWPKQSWHHLALAWADLGAGKSLLRWYADGALVLERADATLGSPLSTSHFAVGRNTAGQGGGFVGLMDELRISNRPRRSAEVRDAYQRGLAHQPLESDAATLLLVSFDEGTEGISQTRSRPSREALQRLVDELIHEADAP